MINSAAVYPEQLEGDVVLRSGSVAHIRPIRLTDEPNARRSGQRCAVRPGHCRRAGGTLVELRKGYRGSQASDITALEDVLLGVSALIEDHPEIAELDCNPVIVSPSGAVIVDSRVRVSAPAPRRPLSARR